MNVFIFRDECSSFLSSNYYDFHLIICRQIFTGLHPINYLQTKVHKWFFNSNITIICSFYTYAGVLLWNKELNARHWTIIMGLTPIEVGSKLMDKQIALLLPNSIWSLSIFINNVTTSFFSCHHAMPIQMMVQNGNIEWIVIWNKF